MTIDEMPEWVSLQVQDAIEQFRKRLLKNGPNGRSPFIVDYPVDSWIKTINDQASELLNVRSRIQLLQAVADAAREVRYDDGADGSAEALSRALDALEKGGT